MAVKGVLLFQMEQQEFAVALSHTEAVISLYKKDIHKAGVGLISSYLKKTISVVFFSDLFQMKDFSEVYENETFHKTFDQCEVGKKLSVIVVSYGTKYIGIIVDKLLQQKEIIEKSIPKPFDDNKLLSGTTILGNGNVCLVVDIAAVTDILYRSKLKISEANSI
jgi:two-component system chemotaxis sensor kinase CheA